MEQEEFEAKIAELKVTLESMNFDLINIELYIKLIELRTQLHDRWRECDSVYDADLIRVSAMIHRIEEKANEQAKK